MAHGSASEDTAGIADTKSPTPARGSPRGVGQQSALGIGETVRCVLCVMPNHLTGTTKKFVDDVGLAATGANQRLATVDHELVDRDVACWHEEPLTLSDERARVTAMEIHATKTRPLRRLTDGGRHEAVLGCRNRVTGHSSREPMALVKSTEKTLRNCGGFLQAEHEMAFGSAAIEDHRPRVRGKRKLKRVGMDIEASLNRGRPAPASPRIGKRHGADAGPNRAE